MWIGVLGFMRIFSLLSRDRLDNVSKYAIKERERIRYQSSCLVGNNCICLNTKVLQSDVTFGDSIDK
jgi:hypothetical protein